MNLALIPIFLVLGAAAGFMSGLLGIGGGFTIVRVLNVQSECLLRGRLRPSRMAQCRPEAVTRR